MASSISTGDRRWASVRKSGMTVLGKVPKPINLPSQRLENNGLDPNVEIVPKGTLTWGSRPSSAASNVWTSSALLSPKTDGSTGSPSHLNGRPSSGGSGTRPSTAGSDRSQDPSFNAWTSNSRSSTVSGLLPSNQTPIIATRPRSAETRPSSSQLSRFAENVSESTVAWGPSRTSERLGPATSKVDEFTLSSGDFPTLGSEKDSMSNIQRGHSSQGRPASSSGTDSRPIEKLESPRNDGHEDAYSDLANVTALRSEKSSYVGGDIPPNTKWQTEPRQVQPYPVLSMAPHQFDTWHGPPVQPPDGIWYRGATGGPYSPAEAPGTYPVDPFVYYPHQFTPNSEALPRSGAGPSAYHPNNGDPSRPQVPPSSYTAPGHPVIQPRPGGFQTPAPYNGYYSPHQVSYCSSSEQHIPFMGTAARPRFYNQYQNQHGNLNSGEFQTRSGGHDSEMGKEQMALDRAHTIHQGHYKVLLKQHDGCDDSHLQEKREQSIIPTQSHHLDREFKIECPKQEGEQPSVRSNYPSEFGELAPDHQASSLPAGYESHSSHPVTTISEEKSSKASDGILTKEPEVYPSVHGQQNYPVMRKNTALIEKIEVLNNKARSVDSQNEMRSNRQDKSKQSKAIDVKLDHSSKVIFSDTVPAENAPSETGVALNASLDVNALHVSNDVKLGNVTVDPGLSESRVSGIVKSDSLRQGEKTHSHVKKKVQAGRSRVDYHAKPRSDSQNDDGWTKESSGRTSSVTKTGMICEDGPGIGEPNCHLNKEAALKELHTGAVSGSLASSPDSLDYKAQRAKLKEMAAQRAKQLQKEEEERIREQKAKALAKLEELNRRTAAQSLLQKSDALPPTDIAQHQEDGFTLITGAVTYDSIGVVSVGKSNARVQACDSGLKNHRAQTSTMSSTSSETDSKETTTSYAPPLPDVQETSATEGFTQNNTSLHFHDSNGSRPKLMSYGQRQKDPQEKTLSEKSIIAEIMESPKNIIEVSLENHSDEKLATAENMDSPNNPFEVSLPASNCETLTHNADYSVQRKKKNNRNSRNKTKVDEVLISFTLQSSSQTTENIEDPTNVSHKTLHLIDAEVPLVPTETFAEASENQGSSDATVASFQHEWTRATQDPHEKINNQWKSQPTRRSRNQQAIRPTDKFHGSETVIWAPVKPLSKNEQSEESRESTFTDNTYQSSCKSEQNVHSGTKTKRAEMERYVPKPVAKELSQQENSRQSSSSYNQSLSSDLPGKPYLEPKTSGMTRLDVSSIGKSEFIADTGIVEDKSNRRGRTHTSWRQRNSAESTPSSQNSNEGTLTSDVVKTLNKTSDQHVPSKPEEQLKSDCNKSINTSLSAEPVVLPEIVKDQGVTGRPKRQHFKVHRPGGSSTMPPDHNHLQGRAGDTSAPNAVILDLNVPDARSGALRIECKNPGGEHTRTHWKPKSNPYFHTQQQGDNGNGGLRVGSFSGQSDKELGSQGSENNRMHSENSSSLAACKDGMTQIRDAGKQEAEGNKKVASNAILSKSHSTYRPNQDVSNNEFSPINVSAQHEQQSSDAPRRHCQHAGHFNRGQEAAYRSRDLGQDSRKQNLLGGKQKPFTHFEYQPVGSYNKPSDLTQSNSNVFQDATDGRRAPPRQRYSEQGHSQTRHNNHFFKRSNSATVYVGDSHHSGE